MLYVRSCLGCRLNPRAIAAAAVVNLLADTRVTRRRFSPRPFCRSSSSLRSSSPPPPRHRCAGSRVTLIGKFGITTPPRSDYSHTPSTLRSRRPDHSALSTPTPAPSRKPSLYYIHRRSTAFALSPAPRPHPPYHRPPSNIAKNTRLYAFAPRCCHFSAPATPWT